MDFPLTNSEPIEQIEHVCKQSQTSSEKQALESKLGGEHAHQRTVTVDLSLESTLFEKRIEHTLEPMNLVALENTIHASHADQITEPMNLAGENKTQEAQL